MATGDSSANQNPWMGLPTGDESANHAQLMKSIMGSQVQAPQVQKQGNTLDWLAMRAVEKDPVLSTVTGHTFTPIDTWGTGQQQQSWNSQSGPGVNLGLWNSNTNSGTPYSYASTVPQQTLQGAQPPPK